MVALTNISIALKKISIYLESAQTYLHADIESVQRRFATSLQGLSNLSNSNYLRLQELLSLESVHINPDIITTYKIVLQLIYVSLNDVGLNLSSDKNKECWTQA